ncbi:hypothetical protein [Promicromonospora panici]|uniref:hypothetical protein n=1 Tax=Promicromonospora panici TaxID=2219658 RepID=UPI00101CC748|nr:hypothetical protein [Promicromonospora panici]
MGAAAAILFMIAAVLNEYESAILVIVQLAAAGFLAAWAGLVLATHPFLLLPRRYLHWLRTIQPYEPETFWGQSLQRLVSWSGACLALILGSIVGAELGAQKTASQLSDAAWQWAGLLLLGGFVYVWWTRFLVELADTHRRALKRGQLATRPAAGASVWLLFLTIWIFGFVATIMSVAIAPFAWQAFLRFIGINEGAP